jgi:hypothetical protein
LLSFCLQITEADEDLIGDVPHHDLPFRFKKREEYDVPDGSSIAKEHD